MFVCMNGHHFQQSMDRPGKAANPARGQLNRDTLFSPLPPFAPLRIWSPETCSAVPSRVSPFILYTQAESGLCYEPLAALCVQTTSGRGLVHGFRQSRVDQSS